MIYVRVAPLVRLKLDDPK
jgi:hypothetical protein